MNRNTFAHTLAKGIRLWAVATLLAGLTVVALGLLGAGSVYADPPITVGDGWHYFEDTDWDSWNDEGPFTFTSSATVILRVTDVDCRGEEYDIYDNGVLIGPTSVVTPDPQCFPSVADPDATFPDPDWSSGTFTLGPGAHAITIQFTQLSNPEPMRMDGYLRVDLQQPGVAPEASTLLLLGSGLAGLGTYARLRWRARKGK